MREAQTGTCRIPLITGLLRHREVTRLRFYAETLGLDVTHRHDGGIITRHHMVTIRGRRDDMLKLFRYLRTTAFESEGADYPAAAQRIRDTLNGTHGQSGGTRHA